MTTKTRQNLLFILIAIVLVTAFYIVFSINSKLRSSINYIFVRNGRITNYEEASAIIIRDEKLVDISSFSGEMHIVAYDNSKVAKGDVLVAFSSKQDADIVEQINAIDDQIQGIIENSTIEYSQEIKSIENNIEKEIYDLISSKNDIYDVNITKKNIYSDLEKKINLIGASYPKNNELNNLLKERKELEKQKDDSKKYLTVDESSFVSYRIDGYEDIFNANNFSTLSVKNLKSVKYMANQQIPISTDKIKLINNFYCYLAIIAKSDDAKKLNLNDTIRISLDKDFQTYEKATIDYIIDNGDERILVLKIYNNIEKLSQYRKINCYIVWWNYEGMKVQNDTIYETTIKNNETGEEYAKVSALKLLGTTGYQKEVWIKVENTAEGFSIVSNYDDNELIGMGIPQEIVENRNKLNLYDRVVIIK